MYRWKQLINEDIDDKLIPLVYTISGLRDRIGWILERTIISRAWVAGTYASASSDEYSPVYLVVEIPERLKYDDKYLSELSLDLCRLTGKLFLVVPVEKVPEEYRGEPKVKIYDELWCPDVVGVNDRSRQKQAEVILGEVFDKLIVTVNSLGIKEAWVVGSYADAYPLYGEPFEVAVTSDTLGNEKLISELKRKLSSIMKVQVNVIDIDEYKSRKGFWPYIVIAGDTFA